MTTEMKARGLVAIPPVLAKKLDLHKGDLFDIREEDGNLILVPIVIKPKKLFRELEAELASLKEALKPEGEEPQGE